MHLRELCRVELRGEFFQRRPDNRFAYRAAGFRPHDQGVLLLGA
jgi:hypothetical protein